MLCFRWEKQRCTKQYSVFWIVNQNRLYRTYTFQISCTYNRIYPVMCKYVTSCLWEFRNDCSEFWLCTAVSVSQCECDFLSQWKYYALSLSHLTGWSEGLPPHSCPGKRGQGHRVGSGWGLVKGEASCLEEWTAEGPPWLAHDSETADPATKNDSTEKIKEWTRASMSNSLP